VKHLKPFGIVNSFFSIAFCGIIIGWILSGLQSYYIFSESFLNYLRWNMPVISYEQFKNQDALIDYIIYPAKYIFIISTFLFLIQKQFLKKNHYLKIPFIWFRILGLGIPTGIVLQGWFPESQMDVYFKFLFISFTGKKIYFSIAFAASFLIGLFFTRMLLYTSHSKSTLQTKGFSLLFIAYNFILPLVGMLFLAMKYWPEGIKSGVVGMFSGGLIIVLGSWIGVFIRSYESKTMGLFKNASLQQFNWQLYLLLTLLVLSLFYPYPVFTF
jgi:hypothetical protein